MGSSKSNDLIWAAFLVFITLCVLSPFLMTGGGVSSNGRLIPGEVATREVERPSQAPEPQPTTTPSSVPADSPTPTGQLTTVAPTSTLPDGCDVPKGPSVPIHLEPDGVDLSAAARGNPPPSNVLSMEPVNGIPPDPPNFDPGRFAWSSASGQLMDPKGFNSLFMAHTYSMSDEPLGNQMLAVLHEGDIVRVVNDSGETLCYEVAERLAVPANSQILSERSGQGMMIIIVCSDYEGGVWTTRTLWFGKLLK